MAALACLLGANPRTASSAADHELRIQFTSKRFSILEVDESGMSGTPDGQITFLREDGALRFWLPANLSTLELTTTNFIDLHSEADPAVAVLSPTGGENFDSEYAQGSKVLRLPNGDLAMLYHAEHHPCTGNNAEVSVGLAVSSDDGVTWERQGAVLQAPPLGDIPCAERTFYGDGSFSAVVSPDREYLYMYFNQWMPNDYAPTAVARARIDSGLGPGTWWKYHDGTWTEPGLGGRVTGVLPIPTTVKDQFEKAVAIPTVSWNTAYNMWLAVYVSITGFWYSSSYDGLNWSPPHQLIDDVVMFAPESMVDHHQYIYYPSLIDVRADEDGRTSKDGLLIYAKGGWTSAHHMVGRNVEITEVAGAELANTGDSSSAYLVALLLLLVGVFSRLCVRAEPLWLDRRR